jgi:glycosyltransferase involved in cell wall biosynthesis
VKVWEVDMRREFRPFADLRSLFAIREILREQEFDILHLHSAKAGALGRVAGRLVGGGVIVYTPHAFPFLRGGASGSLCRMIERILRPWTDRLMAVSHAEAALAREIGYPEEHVATIRNGVRILDAVSAPASAPHGKKLVVGMVGALRKQKDPLAFVEAAAIVHLACPSAKFELCGDGADKAAVRDAIRRHGLAACFTMHGRAPDASPFLRSWDVFVLSSRYEGLSYSLLEAMAAGKAVVATRAPGNEEVVEDGVSGVLTPPEDPNELAEGVLHVLRDGALRARLGAEARKRVGELFGLERQLQELDAFYRETTRE